ncbi:putative membrane protein [Propionispora sp. 2/2-37]|uniref:CidA/LrgA family protein n=1 Tax=Propionispora sp. 2/2-37 TaxID=1677858 RepID=UPI0006BB748C|nr:CidA/LrgA family protein [Propionispora sp. 2/2-37]CUH94914.1 putative membrane protein [Propionispora sp. 2/2-37]
MKCIKVLLQVLLLCFISLLSNEIAPLLPFKIPGSIIGILIVFVLLERQWLPLNWIENGANLLISELLLFFIPSVVGIMQFSDVLWPQSLGLFTVIAVSTLAMLSFIYLATVFLGYYRERRQRV